MSTYGDSTVVDVRLKLLVLTSVVALIVALQRIPNVYAVKEV